MLLLLLLLLLQHQLSTAPNMQHFTPRADSMSGSFALIKTQPFGI